jgi:hypothetical protein
MAIYYKSHASDWVILHEEMSYKEVNKLWQFLMPKPGDSDFWGM